MPLPVPKIIHDTPLELLHAQLFPVVTVTLPAPPPSVNDAPEPPSTLAGHGTVRANVVDEVTPQLSVAVMVTVWTPYGPALLADTVPVDAFTNSVPVNVGDETATSERVPVSVGAALAVIVPAAPDAIDVSA
jgi:hypothetical protein